MRIFALLLILATTSALADDALQGRWRPDQDANSVLAQSDAPAAAASTRPGRPDGMRGGGGGKGGMGGGMARHGGGGGRHGRGAGDDAASPSPRSDGDSGIEERLAPRVADLLLARDGNALVIGADADALHLRIDGDPVALPGSDAKATLRRSGDDLVLALDGPRGIQSTHTYRLEGDGKRLRVLTSIQRPDAPKPIERQRLYRRTETLTP